MCGLYEDLFRVTTRALALTARRTKTFGRGRLRLWKAVAVMALHPLQRDAVKLTLDGLAEENTTDVETKVGEDFACCSPILSSSRTGGFVFVFVFVYVLLLDSKD